MNTTVYILGILLQAIAGVIALSQVRYAPHKMPWLLIALSSLLIVIRRTATLEQVMETGGQLAIPEVITLVISLLFFLGVALMSRMFNDISKGQLALREASKRLDEIIEHLPDATFVIDTDKKVVAWNRTIEQMTGVPKQEIIGKDHYEYAIPFYGERRPIIIDLAFLPDEEFEKKKYDDVRRDGDTLQGEVYVPKTYGGKGAYLSATASKLKDSSGIVVGAIESIRDITDRKKAEDALRESEARFRSYFDLPFHGIAITSPERGWIQVNDRLCSIMGYSRDEIVRLTWSEMTHPDDLAPDLEQFNRVLSGQTDQYNMDKRFIRKDGEVIWTNISVGCVRKSDGSVDHVVAMVEDITSVKLAEEALRQERILYEDLVNTEPAGVYRLRVKLSSNWQAEPWSSIVKSMYSVDMASDRYCSILGISHEEFMTNAGLVRDLIHPDDKRDFDVLNMEAITRLSPFTWEGRIIRDHQTRWIHFESLPRVLESETVLWTGIVYDITERKKMEETLREHDTQLKKLTSWAPGMMYQFTKRPDGTLCVPFTTEAVKDVFGCSPEDIREDFSPIARVILPEDLDKIIDSIEYSAKHLTIWACEYRVQIPGQSIRWLLGRSTPEKLADGSITWYGFNTDITEIKKAEEALRKSEEEFRSLAESMPQIVWVTRKDGWNIYFNQQWVDYTGLTLEESYGHGWNIPFHPDDRQRAWSAWENATKNNGNYSLECRLRRTDGVYHWWLVRGVPLLDETGEIIKWFGTCTDIDKIKHTEEQLQDTLEGLRKALGATIQVMVSAVEARDPYTAGHQIRSADLARAIATEMGLSRDKIEGIRMAGSIHDIGKLSIPAEILSKPTKLSEIEFSLIKEHARKGYEMLNDVESPWPLAEIVYQHHERINGSGYPRNLKGEEIIMEARIMAVADVVESMSSHRPYRPSLGIEAALEEIEKNKGTLYDDAVADACLKLFREKSFQLG
jgi:PAS domain S-box-containing protein